MSKNNFVKKYKEKMGEEPTEEQKNILIKMQKLCNDAYSQGCRDGYILAKDYYNGVKQ